MGRFFIILWFLLALGSTGSFSIPLPGHLLWAQSPRFSLQVASFETEVFARKEVDRLKLLGISATLSRISDAQKKIWYIVYIDSFKNKEEALAYGNNLKAKNIINNFILLLQQINKIDDKAMASRMDSKPPAPREKTLRQDGPLKLQEGPDFLRLELLLDRRTIPEVRSEKGETESRIILSFKSGEPSFLPLEFQRREGLLRFFSVLPSGKGYTLTLGFNPEFNYQVAQDYFERERLYTLTVTKIP
ncbi:MAG: SPOR domain-containing protein [Deltaproteobacteria bacterium]|nr:SPOR domain-containing protein [Deltaproteobacteria bacterium]